MVGIAERGIFPLLVFVNIFTHYDTIRIPPGSRKKEYLLFPEYHGSVFCDAYHERLCGKWVRGTEYRIWAHYSYGPRLRS